MPAVDLRFYRKLAKELLTNTILCELEAVMYIESNIFEEGFLVYCGGYGIWLKEGNSIRLGKGNSLNLFRKPR